MFLLRELLFLLLAVSSFICTADSDLNGVVADSLGEVLAKASGIYRDTNLQLGLERTVLVTGCNHGFLNHLHNFKCFCDRLGLKFLVVALDEKSYVHLVKHSDVYVYYMSAGVDNSSAPIASENANFRSHQFNLITARKKEAVHDILSLGYDVVFSDTDVAIVHDPMPYLLWKNVDYVHSLNAPCTTYVDHVRTLPPAHNFSFPFLSLIRSHSHLSFSFSFYYQFFPTDFRLFSFLFIYLLASQFLPVDPPPHSQPLHPHHPHHPRPYSLLLILIISVFPTFSVK